MSNKFIPFKEFMDRAKDLICKGQWLFIPTRKNQSFLTAHGLIFADIKDMVMGLSKYSLYKGPTNDIDPEHETGTIYIFTQKYDIEEDGNLTKVYIKLKIPDCTDKLVILSFHEEGSFK